MIEFLMYRVDHAPLGYLAVAASLLFFIGTSVSEHHQVLKLWQAGVGSSVFITLTLRRLFWQPPYEFNDGLEIVGRATAFSVIAVGTTGGFGLLINLIWSLFGPSKYQIQAWWRWWADWRRRRSSQSSIQPTAAEVLRRQIEHQSRLSQQAKEQSEKLKRQELKLQAELELEYSADKQRRDRIARFIQEYVSDSLPIEEYEKRLAQICDSATKHAPKQARNFNSIQEIIEFYAQQIDDIDKSHQSEFEKESLRASVTMERQVAIQRFFQS